MNRNGSSMSGSSIGFPCNVKIALMLALAFSLGVIVTLVTVVSFGSLASSNPASLASSGGQTHRELQHNEHFPNDKNPDDTAQGSQSPSPTPSSIVSKKLIKAPAPTTPTTTPSTTTPSTTTPSTSTPSTTTPTTKVHLNHLVRSNILETVGTLKNYVDDKTHEFTELAKGLKFDGNGWEAINNAYHNQKSKPLRPILVSCPKDVCLQSLFKTGLDGLEEDVRVVLVGVFEQNFGGFGQHLAGIHGGVNLRAKPHGEKVVKLLDDNRLVAWFSNQMPIDVHEKIVSVPLGIHYSWNHKELEKVYKANKTEAEMESVLLKCKTLEKRNGVCPAIHDFLYQNNLNVPPNRRVVELAIPFVPRAGKFSFRSQLYEYAQSTMLPAFEKVGKSISFLQNCSGESYKEKCPMYESYFNMVENSKFCLSPGGLGFDCYRTYECLLAGCIPIVMSSPMDKSFHNLPIITVGSFTDVTPAFLEQEEAKVIARILNGTIDFNRLTFNYWKDVIKKSVSEYDETSQRSDVLLSQFPLPAWKHDHQLQTLNPKPKIKEWFEKTWKSRKQQKEANVFTVGLNAYMTGKQSL